MADLMQKTKKELVEIIQELQLEIAGMKAGGGVPPVLGKGWLIFTPEPPDPSLPKYTGKTGGMFFRNGVAFMNEDDLDGFPPPGGGGENKVQRFCKDFGYTYREGTSDEALKLMGGMDAVMIEPTMPGRA